VRQTKVERKEKKEKYLREVTVKIGLKQEEKEEGIVTKALLDSGVTGLVMSEEFAKKHRFRRMKLERLVYVRNVDSTLNYVGPIVDTVEVEIFFKGHKEQTLIDVIGGQKWSVILGMPWLETLCLVVATTSMIRGNMRWSFMFEEYMDDK